MAILKRANGEEFATCNLCTPDIEHECAIIGSCINNWYCLTTARKCTTPLECSKRETGCKMVVNLPGTGGIKDTLSSRGKRYGDFTDNADISQSFKEFLRLQPGYNKLDKVKREALEMIAQKIARILNGDPEYRDNWHDIAGYAMLAEERCKM